MSEEVQEGNVEVYADPELKTVEISFKYALKGLRMDPKAARLLGQCLMDAADQAERKPRAN